MKAYYIKMPGKIIDRYDHVPVTKEDCKHFLLTFQWKVSQINAKRNQVDWAELITLDLSEYEKPGGKQALVKKLEHAVRHVGEYYSPINFLSYIHIDLR